MRSGDHAALGPGWYAVSVNYLTGYRYFETDEPVYAYFQQLEPVASAGYSIYIYHVTPDDVDKFKSTLEVPTSVDEPSK